MNRQFLKFSFTLLALLLIQVGCTSSRRTSSVTTDSSAIPTTTDPFGTDYSSDTTDPFATDDLFLPGYDDEEVEETTTTVNNNSNQCTSSSWDGLGIGYPEDYNPATSAALSCVNGGQDQAMQMLLLQSLSSFEHMGECFQMAMAQINGFGMGMPGMSVATSQSPVADSSQEFEFRVVSAQLGMIRCYRKIHNKITASIPWMMQAQQNQQGGDMYYMQLIQQLLASLKD